MLINDESLAKICWLLQLSVVHWLQKTLLIAFIPVPEFKRPELNVGFNDIKLVVVKFCDWQKIDEAQSLITNAVFWLFTEAVIENV